MVDYGDAAASMNTLHIADSFILSEKVKKSDVRTTMVLEERDEVVKKDSAEQRIQL